MAVVAIHYDYSWSLLRSICELGEMFQPLHKQAASVQPFGLAQPTDCGGVLCKSAATIRLRGNMNSGGRCAPATLMAHIVVTVVPPSPLVIFPTCLTPLVATIIPGFCTLVMPVSSIFHTRAGMKGASPALPVYMKELLNFRFAESYCACQIRSLWCSCTKAWVTRKEPT